MGSVLPQVPRRGNLTQAPQPTASGDTVARPFAVISEVFGRMSGIALDKAAADATDRGANAVTRDEAGNLKVTLMSNLTEIGRNYNRAAMSAYLARLSGDIRTAAADFSRQANGDVRTFDGLWQGYAERMEATAPAMIRGAVTSILADEGGATSRGITAATFDSDVAKGLNALRAEQARLSDELLTLAASGGAGTPEFVSRLQRYQDIGAEIAGNPAYSASPEAEELARDRLVADTVIEATRHSVMAEFPGDPVRGIAAAEQRLNDPSLALSPTERRQALASIRQGYEQVDAARRAAIDALDGPVDELVGRMTAGLAFDETRFDAMYNEALRLNATTEITRLTNARTRYGVIAALDAGDDRADVALWGTLTSGGGSIVDRIIGVESGGDPTAANPNSTALGAGQFITTTWLQMIRAHRPDLAEGKTDAEILAMRTDPVLSREMVGHLAQDNAIALGMRRIEATAGNLYLAHFLGAGGAIAVLTAAPGTPVAAVLSPDAIAANRSILEGKTVEQVAAWAAGKMGEVGGIPGVTPELMADVRSEIGTGLDLYLDRLDAGLDVTGQAPGVDDANLIFEMARIATDDPRLAQRAAQSLLTYAGAASVNGDMEGAQALRDAAAALMANVGPGGDEAAVAWITEGVNAQRDHIDDLRATNPIREAVEAGYVTTTPIDFTSPDAITAELSARAQGVARFRIARALPAMSLLDAREAQELALRWSSIPVDQRIALATAIGRGIRDGDTLRATLGSIAGEGATALAFAAGLVAVSPADAEGIVRGQQILAADPSRAPKAAEWAEDINAALPVAMFSGLAEDEPMRQAVMTAVMYRYVDLAHRAGHAPGASIDATLLGRAVDGVTGGMVDFNGHEIIAPVYGMSQRDFDVLVGRPALYNRAPSNPSADMDVVMQGARTADGLPVVWADIYGAPDARLRNVGDGRYIVQFGPDAAPTFLYGADGRVFELNLRLAAVAPLGRDLANRFGVRPRTRGLGMTDLYATQGRNYSAPVVARVNTALASREKPNVVPGSRQWEEAQNILTTSPPRGLDSLTRENFYALMVVMDRPRGELLRLLAEQWSTSVVVINQRLGLVGL